MRTRTPVLAVLLAILAIFAVIVAYQMLPGADPPRSDREPAGPDVHHANTRARASTGAPARAGVTEAEDAAPVGPGEEAMRAAIVHSGEGWVRCVLPEGIGRVDVDRLNWASQRGNVLSMAATEPAGEVELRRGDAPPEPDPTAMLGALSDLPELGDDAESMTDVSEAMVEASEAFMADRAEWAEKWSRPSGIARWEAAEPGERGRCSVTVAGERVTMTVAVVRPDGTPARSARVGSGFTTEPTSVGSDGTLQIEAWEGMPVAVVAFDGTGMAFGRGTGVAGGTIEVVLGGDEARERLGDLPDRLDMRDRMEDDLDRQVDPLRQALEDPDLSEAAAAQIQAWIDRATQRTDKVHDLLDKADELTERLKTVLGGDDLDEVEAP